MKPTKPNQIVKFSVPLTDSEIEATFIIKEIFFDVERPRTIVKALNQGGVFASTHSYLVEDLEVISDEYAT
jgi:hypothetical protein